MTELSYQESDIKRGRWIAIGVHDYYAYIGCVTSYTNGVIRFRDLDGEMDQVKYSDACLVFTDESPGLLKEFCWHWNKYNRWECNANW